ncbi:hypothetical protein ACRALDRAFT_209383 [Sodiomyces alcalophilus JCM 7366]|uniref:uncharacterized protein n=1 Tax=Sodiomyces alcalophilus JCM 7366 TaxID=591952 RepID=UPI0039B4128B
MYKSHMMKGTSDANDGWPRVQKTCEVGCPTSHMASMPVLDGLNKREDMNLGISENLSWFAPERVGFVDPRFVRVYDVSRQFLRSLHGVQVLWLDGASSRRLLHATLTGLVLILHYQIQRTPEAVRARGAFHPCESQIAYNVWCKRSRVSSVEDNGGSPAPWNDKHSNWPPSSTLNIQGPLQRRPKRGYQPELCTVEVRRGQTRSPLTQDQAVPLGMSGRAWEKGHVNLAVRPGGEIHGQMPFKYSTNARLLWCLASYSVVYILYICQPNCYTARTIPTTCPYPHNTGRATGSVEALSTCYNMRRIDRALPHAR